MKHEVKVNIPEGVKERLDRAKQHLKDNKTTYLVGASCLAAGYLLRKPQVVTIVNDVKPTIAPVMNNIGNVVHNTVNNGGHMRKIVRCLETDEMWPSVGKAAEAAGASISKMSQHVNGHKEHVNGLHYVIEGLASGDLA